MKNLQWHEPPAYRRAIYYENERADPLNSLKFAGFAILFLVGLRLLAGPFRSPFPERNRGVSKRARQMARCCSAE